MEKNPYENVIYERSMREIDVPIWPNGPSLNSLMNRFASSCIASAHLDSWLPLASPKMQPIIGYFFQGFALRLADKLLVHAKVANIALAFTFINQLFPAKPPAESISLMSRLGNPRLDGTVEHEAIHMLGADAAVEWMNNGFDNAPPTWQITEFVKLTETYAIPEALNPEGISDLAISLTHHKELPEHKE